MPISKLLRFAPGRETLFQIAVLMGGAGGAQIVTLAFSPVLTRLYSPEVFGHFNGMLSVISILSVLAPLAYPIAIVLPRSDRVASGLAKISVLCIILISTVILIGLVTLSWRDSVSWGIAECLLMSISVLLASSVMVLNYWKMREQRFRLMGMSALVRSFVLALAQFVLAFVSPSALVLLWAFVLAQISGVIVLLRGGRPTMEGMFRFRSLSRLARVYIDFPALKAPEQLMSSLTQNIPLLVLLAYYGPATAGAFALASRLLMAPITLGGKVIVDVLYPKFTRLSRDGQSLFGVLVRCVALSGAAGILPFAFVAVFGTESMSLLFGKGWAEAGVFAELLVIWLFVDFLNRCCIAAVPVLRWQGGLLVITTVSGVVRIFGVWAVGEFGGSAYTAVLIYSLVGAISGCILVCAVLMRAVQPIPKLLPGRALDD